MKTIQEKVNEIIKKSEGHQVTYQYGEEDGSMVEDRAIPLGWFKEWLKVGLTQIQKETINEIIGKDEKLKLKAGLTKEMIGFETTKNALRNELRSEQQCEEYPCCGDDYCLTHKQHMRFCMEERPEPCDIEICFCGKCSHIDWCDTHKQHARLCEGEEN